MEKYERAVFISYAWGEETSEREAIVNQIDQSLQKRGLKIVRDKRDLGYKGSISKFMERIGEGDSIIVVISDKYLRSKNCMYELVEIAENKQFADRVFPIVLPDAKIYDAGDRVDYIKHWAKQKEKLNRKYATLQDKSNTESILEELSNYDRFGDEIDGLTGLLKDMNTLSPDMHKDSDFSDLFAAIENRMKELGSKLEPVIQDNRQVSAAPSQRKPISVGILIGGAAILLVIALIAINTLGNRGSKLSATAEPTQPSALGEPTEAVATQAVPPILAATEVTATGGIVATATEEIVPTATATQAPPTYFAETFPAGIDHILWESFILGKGDRNKASVTKSDTGAGLNFVLDDLDLRFYYIYKQPIPYKDVVLRIRAVWVPGGTFENKVSLICRRVGNAWYEYSVSSGGKWNLVRYNDNSVIPIWEGATKVNSGQEPNDYAMSCIGNEISLRVNGAVVRTLTDNNLTEGQVGFNVSSIGKKPVKIELKNFEVAEP